jgi:phage terminase large subunit
VRANDLSLGALYGELRMRWRADPVLYAKQRFAINPTWQQAAILRALAPEGAKVSVRSGHGIGKTTTLAIATWWHAECFENSRTPITAPGQPTLSTVVWPELAKLRRKADEQAARLGLPESFWLSALFNFTATRISHALSPEEWFAAARTSRKENPAALQGFHASDIEISADGREVIKVNTEGASILFVIEEASGVPDEIFEVARGALSSHNVRLLMQGNPTQNSGFFFNSHTVSRANYTALHFRCDDSPLVPARYREELVTEYGEGSNVVRVRADGEFPLQDDDALISLEMTEAALLAVPHRPEGPRRMGVDVARYGDDRTVFLVRQSANVLAGQVHARQDTMETVGKAKVFAEANNVQEIYVDVIGVGAGVADRLRELARAGELQWTDEKGGRHPIKVYDVNVAEAAPLREQGDGVEAQPAKLRDHLWLEARNWLRDEAPSFIPVGASKAHRDVAQRLAAELATVLYSIDSSGRLVVESKDERKQRLSRATESHAGSPDLADALCLTFYTPPTQFVGRINVRGF